MVSDVEEMIPKPIKYSIFGLTNILYIADIAFQAIFAIIAFVIPIHHSTEGMCCAMSGYIAIMTDPCTILRSFGPITLVLWTLFALGDLSPNQNVFGVFELLKCDHYGHTFMYWCWYKSNPGVGQDDGWMQHTDRDTHVCMKLCKEDGAGIELDAHV